RDLAPPQKVWSMLWAGDVKPDELESGAAGNKPLFNSLFETRVAALGGACSMTTRKTDDYFRLFDRDRASSSSNMIVRAMLARTCEVAGDNAAALRALQAGDSGRVSMYWGSGRSSAAYWHRIRYDEARLLRKLGR